MNASRSFLFRLSNPIRDCVAVMTLTAGLATAQTWTVASPDGVVKLSAALVDGKLTSRIEHGAEGRSVVVLQNSPLGLRLRNQDFASRLQFEAGPDPRPVEQNYTLVHG